MNIKPKLMSKPMSKTTKGALAAAAAGVLLLGGAGTLAYWTDTEVVPGTDITSGHFYMDASDCNPGTWTLDGGDPYTANDPLVPGDTLTKECDIVMDIAGTHLTHADFEVSAPEIGGIDGENLVSELSATVTVNGGGSANNVPVTDGQVLPVEITITWPWGVEDNYNNLDQFATIDGITVIATQEHDDEDNHSI